jgi:succinate-acetate transporter protein
LSINNPSEREADVAPAPEHSGGWSPADPGPLGLAAFAMTIFVWSIYNANLVNTGGSAVVLGLALAYGGIALLLAGMWEFRTGNTFGAVAFCSFGAFWISFFVLSQFEAKAIPAAQLNNALAVYLYGWGIFTGYMLIASMRTTAAVALVFALLTATFFLLAIGHSGTNSDVIHAGGWVGIATAIASWYASMAAVVNSTFGRVVMPVMPLARASGH